MNKELRNTEAIRKFLAALELETNFASLPKDKQLDLILLLNNIAQAAIDDTFGIIKKNMT